MPVSLRQSANCLLLTVCLLVCVGSPGCGWLADGVRTELPLAASGPAEVPDSASQTAQPAPSGPAADSSGDRAVLARGGDAEGRSVWIRAAGSSQEGSPQQGYRWRNPSVEGLLARPPGRRPNWRRYLADKDPIVATNAAIALARSGDDSGAERLAEAVWAPEVNGPMRYAAVEALAGLTGPSAVPLLRELLDQYGGRTSRPGAAYDGELHAELIRGLARHVDPAEDPHFLTALRSPASSVRAEAVRAWADGRGGTLPVEVAELRADRDRTVRAAALRTLARRRHPKAHAYLVAALRDHELRVRKAAIAGLGELGGSQPQATLEGLLENQSEAIRAAAVSALDRLGAERAVLGAARDRSWRVRLKVAQALADYADEEAAAAARQLLADPSAEVQRQVVLALTEWPLRQAGPILLEAMGSRTLVTREAAAEQLAARWPPAAEFPSTGQSQLRTAAIEKLRGRFGQEFGQVDSAGWRQAAADERPVSPVTPQTLGRVEQLVGRGDVQALVDFGPGLIDALEHLVFDRQQLLPEAIYRDVLPRYGPIYVALDRLACSDVAERRRAASELAGLAGGRPLGRLAAARLNQLVVTEPDPLVWQSVLTAVAGDPSEPAIGLAYAAVGHPSADVRRRACEHLAAHPDPGHAKVLLPAVEDPDYAVVCAAVRALGAGGRLDDTAPLRRLLRRTDESLRLETAVALARLGDPAGKAALQRLIYSPDSKIRHRVAEAMGETGDAMFTPTLIRLLDDRAAVRGAALEGLPKVVGFDASGSDGQSPASTSERARRWKRWFEGRPEFASGSGPSQVN